MQAPSLSYRGPAHGPAYEFWREEFLRRVMSGDMAPLADGPIDCNIAALALPGVRLSGASGSPMSFRATGGDKEQALALVLGADVAMRIESDRRTLDIQPGGIGLADTMASGSSVSQSAAGRFRSVFIDRRRLLARCPDAEALVARPHAGAAGAAALLGRYYDLALADLADADALTRDAAAQHIIDLVTLVLGVSRDAAEMARQGGAAAARFALAKAEIARALGDGGLTLTQLALRCGASPRTIQSHFEAAGTSFSQYLMEQRLLRAERLLRSAALAGRGIADIAGMAGFNDLSYFHRCFRRRFGATPADYRAAFRS
ncbi:MAG: helix-turn-helix transcriptional regulator [Micropepsaceae bacterium]